MMKFFRKYTKQLLAVFMALLMIVFVGGSALEALLTPSGNQLIAKSRLGNITSLDQSIATTTNQILESLGQNWRQPLGPVGTPPLERLDWILLVREAEQLGTRRTTTALRSLLADQIPPEEVNSAARRQRVKPDRILEAVADLTSVREAARAVASAAAPSEAEIRSAARDTLDKVKIQAVLLTASAFEDENWIPSDEAMQAQFQAHREKKPGKGLDFGYFMPPAVRIQYVKIDRDVIAGNVRLPNLETKARKYFDQAREADPAFRRPLEELEAESTEPTPEGAEPKPKKSAFLEWDEAKAIAEAHVRKEAAAEAATRMADWLISQMNEIWYEVARQQDNYKPTPDAAKNENAFSVALSHMPDAIGYREAVSVATTDFITAEKTQELDGIGQASHQPVRGPRQTLSTMAFRTKGLVPNIPTDGGANLADYLSPFQTCTHPLTDSNGNMYVFRVIDTKDEHVPESIEDVRDRVIADLRLKKGYEIAKMRAEGVNNCPDAETDFRKAFESEIDLASLNQNEGASSSGFFEPPPFPRVRSYGPTSAPKDSPVFVPGVGLIQPQVVDRLFDLEYEVDKVVVIEMPERAAVLVARWLETIPGRQYEFEASREQLVADLSRGRTQSAVAKWLSPETIRARTQMVLADDRSR